MAVKSLDRLLLLWASFTTTVISTTTIPRVVEAKPISTTSTASSSYSTTTSSASDFTLSSDITYFIPSCALSCFESFIEANFNTTICGTSPSLQCLCQQTGSSGYTIGEGATECIVAEANIGNCEGDDSNSSTIENAYGMCDGVTNAAPETHATLTATLVVVSGSVFVPDTKTTSTKISNTSSSSVISTTTSATSTSTTSSTLATSTTSSSSTTSSTIVATSTTSPTSTATAAAAASKSLTTAQIGGIAGGVTAAAILAALLALFIFLRRRRGGAGFSRVQDSWNPKRHPQLQGSPGSIPTISAPQYEEPKVMSFTRALAKRVSRLGGGAASRPGTIGLAISPAGAGISVQQQQQQLEQQRLTRWPGGVGSGLMVTNPTPTPPGPVIRRYSPEPPSGAPTMSPGRAVSSFNFFPQSPPQPQHGNGQSSPPQQQLQSLSPPQPTHQPATRPNLTVAIPPPSRPGKQTIKRASTTSTVNGRDSIVTEFAEDGEDMTTLGSALIWRPPNTDANSATTYYVADKWGNWVLGGTGSGNTPPADGEQSASARREPEQPAELETPISKTVEEREAAAAVVEATPAKQEKRKQVIITTAKDETVIQDSEAVKAAMRHLSSPTIPESVALRNLGSGVAQNSGNGGANDTTARSRDSIVPAMPPLKPTIRLVTPESGRLPVNSRSSSVYSNYNLPQQVVPGTDNPMPAAPAGMVTVSKRASRAFPATVMNPTELGMIHPALRGEQQSISDNNKPSRRGSSSGNNNAGFNNGGRRDRSQTMMSQESTTTIASSVGDSDVDIDDFPSAPSSRQPSAHMYQQRPSSQYPVDLSPVIESPGRSPVRYPQIPRSRSSAQMYTSTAAKPQLAQQQKPLNPAIRQIQMSDSRNASSSSDSPTLGSQRSQMQRGPPSSSTAASSEENISYYPARRSSLNPNTNARSNNPGLARTGSPNMVGPEELVVAKSQRPHYQQPAQPVSQSLSPSRSTYYTTTAGQQQEVAAAASAHPQSFQTRINNRSQLPSQSHMNSNSRYGPSSVYDIYNDPTISSSRPASQQTVIISNGSKPTPTPSYQAFQKQTTTSPAPPQPTTTFIPSPPSSISQYPGPGPSYSSNNTTTTMTIPSATLSSPLASSTTSTSSALLAKRLGPERAAAFQQVAPLDLSTSSSTQRNRNPWARRNNNPNPQNSHQQQLQQDLSPPPKGTVVRKVNTNSSLRNTSEESNKENKTMTGGGRGVEVESVVDYEGQGYENETQYQQQQQQQQHYYLPATPGWKPQLTPKRRGDDLFLSVQ